MVEKKIYPEGVMTFLQKIEKPGKIQFAQMASLITYLLVAWLHLGLLRPERFYLVIFYTCLLDFLFNLHPRRRTAEGKIKFPITGFVAGSALALLIETPATPVYFLAGTIAVASKFFIRVEKKHVFNPANFAVLSTIVLTGGYATMNIAQWSGAGWLLGLMILVGVTVSTLAGRIVLSVSYLASFLVCASVFSLIKGLPQGFLPGTLLGISTILFTFHMITDPATSPVEKKKQVRAGILVGIVHLILYANNIMYAQLWAGSIVVSILTLIKPLEQSLQEPQVASE